MKFHLEKHFHKNHFNIILYWGDRKDNMIHLLFHIGMGINDDMIYKMAKGNWFSLAIFNFNLKEGELFKGIYKEWNVLPEYWYRSVDPRKGLISK